MKITEDLILEFQCSDFDSLFGKHSGSTIDAADLANKLLRKEMEKWPIVFSDKERDNSVAWAHWSMDEYKLNGCADDRSRSRVMPGQNMKKDSAEDILRDLMSWQNKSNLGGYGDLGLSNFLMTLSRRAKTVLGE